MRGTSSSGEAIVGARRNHVLLALVVALLVATVVGGFRVWRADRDQEAAQARERPYGEVIEAARAHGEALVNLHHDEPATLRRARAGATGDLAEDYTPTGRVGRQVVRNRSQLEGFVVWAGVEELAADEATALVATTGTVRSAQTDGERVTRRLRLRIHLVPEGDAWLADDVELVD
jgi:Mce-associated membrane protein